MNEIVSLKDIVVDFDGERILDELSLDIHDKEFVTFLGPSGCGKTTTLRVIAGFITPKSGNVFFDGKDIASVPPYKRQVNTVFQKYALFPHLNVYENVAFGLRLKKLPDSEIDRELLLERGRLVTVRPHSRFVEFPEHRHNYVEMMYVVQGNITHIIEGKELTLHKGDVLMLNQQVRHAIRRAEYEDIGINFIALPEFFEIPLSMLHEKNVLAEFIVGAFRQKDPVSHPRWSRPPA